MSRFRGYGVTVIHSFQYLARTLNKFTKAFLKQFFRHRSHFEKTIVNSFHSEEELHHATPERINVPSIDPDIDEL